ncbi:MAG: type I 3-dehydroquinate dehydratase, partial [Planctomycetes bacterium]|nr:type I 3-dehydroquinate dehydratase [Planctomycetota bacterium]
MHTLICVSIMVDDDEAALRDADEAKRAGADLVEWRVDEVFHGEGDDHGTQRVERLVARSPLPCIVTCRPTWEGGSYDGDDAARVALFERLGTSDNPPRYIDVELAAYTRSENLRRKVNLAVDHPEQRRDVHTSLILSIHDFDGRPADLSRRLLTMRDELAARVTKVAFRARSLRDNLELFDLPAQQGRPTIALGMGEFGTLSRVLAPKFGGFLTFASLRPAEATAPGQPTVDELLNLYRFREIGPGTRVYGVMGHPLGHSLSPRVHNAGFAQRGIDAVYLPMPIVGAPDPETSYASFKATLGELVDHTGLDFEGASVTLPHKHNLVRFARERGWTIDATAEAIGAGN